MTPKMKSRVSTTVKMVNASPLIQRYSRRPARLSPPKIQTIFSRI
nr:MAG TPA: hypothetical protein [Caudoviricetes sp.]